MENKFNIQDLVNRAAENDVSAIRDLYDKFSREMLSVSYRITGDMSESEDILQEAFLTSFEKLEQLENASSYPSWLKRIVTNKSLTAIRKRVRFSEVNEIPEWEEEDTNPWYSGISFDKIRDAIQDLPDGCRQVLTFYLLEEYKHREIAEMLNISVSTSKSQYRYAIGLLRERLKNEIYE